MAAFAHKEKQGNRVLSYWQTREDGHSRACWPRATRHAAALERQEITDLLSIADLTLWK